MTLKGYRHMFKKVLTAPVVRKLGIALLALTLLGIMLYPPAPGFLQHTASEIHNSLTLGPSVDAAGTADATCDGTADNVQAQALVTALPATGGRLYILTGIYVWANGTTVTDASPGVTISGTGTGTYITGDGVTSPFTAGGNNWILEDLKVSVTTAVLQAAMGATTGWEWRNVTTSDNYHILYSSGASATTYLRGDSTWQVPAAGGVVGAPIFVTASDATAAEKSWAIATGGTVCDGLNDEADWVASQAIAGVGGLVQVSSGHFHFGANVTLTATFRGTGGTRISGSTQGTRVYLAADFTIQCGKDGNVQDMYIEMAAAHAGVGVKFVGEVGFNGRTDLLRGVNIYHAGAGAASYPAGSRCVQLYASSGLGDGSKYIQTCIFPDFILRGAEYGLDIYTIGFNGANIGWVNSNQFRGIIHQGKYGVKLSRENDYGSADVNTFELICESANADSVDYIVLNNASDNYFHVTASDWGYATGALMHTTGYSARNYMLAANGGGLGVLGVHTYIDENTSHNAENVYEEQCADPSIKTLNTSHSSTRPVIQGIWGETVAIGEVVYLKSDGKWWLAKADAEATSGGVQIGVVVGSTDVAQAYTANKYGWIAIQGALVRDDSWAWTVGKPIWISAGTSGLLTETKPVAPTNIQRIVGYATHADYIRLTCSDYYVIVP